MAKRHVYNKYEAEMIENFNKTADSLIGIVDNQGSTRLYSHPGSGIRLIAKLPPGFLKR